MSPFKLNSILVSSFSSTLRSPNSSGKSSSFSSSSFDKISVIITKSHKKVKLIFLDGQVWILQNTYFFREGNKIGVLDSNDATVSCFNFITLSLSPRETHSLQICVELALTFLHDEYMWYSLRGMVDLLFHLGKKDLFIIMTLKFKKLRQEK